MSEDTENTNPFSLKAQLEAITKYAETYNSDGIHILRKAQMHVNKNWIELLEKQKSLTATDLNDLPALAMELSAAELLRRAHIEGEIHIFEHHRSSPILFYFQKEGRNTNLMMCKDHQSYNLGNQVWLKAESINPQGDNQGIRLSSIVAVDRSVNDTFKIDLNFYFLESKRTTTVTATCVLNSQKNFDLTEIKVTVNSQSVLPSGYWILHARNSRNSDENTLLTRWDHGIHITYFSPAPFQAQFTSNATQNSKILPRFSHTAQGNENFYVIDGETLRLVSHISSRNKTLLGKDEIATPIGLAFHENHDSILLRTSKEIGIFFPNQPAKPCWRSFGEGAFLPLPDRSMTSGVTFTLSCLLHPRPNPKGTYPPSPQKTKPLVTSNFGFWFEPNGLVVQYTEAHTKEQGRALFMFNRQLQQRIDSHWFQFAIVKNKKSLKIYIDGEMIQSAVVPEHLHVEDQVNLSCPGFIMAELRLWNKVRTSAELIKYKHTWLPSSEFDGLTAYWHLYVNKDKQGLSFEHVNDQGEIDMIQEPDLSGHGRHLTAQQSGVRQPGELNYHTYTVDQATSPFPKFIPLYNLKTEIQNFELDQSTGRIFWSDKNEKNEVVLFTGSALGQSRATVFIAANIGLDFSLISQTNSLHEELILLHSQRRKIIEAMFFGNRDKHRDNHNELEKAHKKLDKTLTAQVDAREKIVIEKGDNEDRYLTVHEQWQQVVTEMRNSEKLQRLELQTTRQTALDEARNITQSALEDVHASRHPKNN